MSESKRISNAGRRPRQKGSALLVALMTLVGLSLLGLAFVAMSETESAISVNERNHAEVVAISESAAKEVVQWFQDPANAVTLGLMPDQSGGVTNWAKTERVVQGYTGYYKDSTTKTLCDLPFGPANDDLFFGDENSSDIAITRTVASGRTFLDNFNNKLLGPGSDPRVTGEVTSIRVFAPPMLGGVLTPDPGGSGTNFWVGGTRLGVATIAVRVDKFNVPVGDPNRRSIATATCRIVVGQFPLPTPAGPLQSQTALNTHGNFNVNWGLVSSETTLSLSKDYTTLPWVNAYERIHYERGYDSSVAFTPSTVYYVGDVVRPSAAELTANPLLQAHEYMVTTDGTSGPTEPPATGSGAWPTAAGTTITSGGVQFKERFPTAYPINGSSSDSSKPWLFFVATGNFQVTDPWFEVRSAGTISGDPSGPQPYTFPYGSPSTYGATHHFQNQSFNQYPQYRQVVFPTMDYNFWKTTAIAANGQGQVHYLWPAGNVAGSSYTDGVTTQSFNAWTSNGGFCFFDTVNQQNPQNGGSGTLNSTQNPGSSAWVQGFVYLNAPFNTTGVGGGGPAGWFNQPGEPYEDIGYRQVSGATGGGFTAGSFVTDPSGQPVIAGAYNNQWDFQDLAWSNTGSCCSGTKDGKFNVYVKQRTVTNPATNSTYSGWFVVPYYPGCFPGDNSCTNCNCSEPHEPYLNIIYDGTSTLGLNIGWQNPSSETHVAKETDTRQPSGTPVNCTTSPDKCTSNGYDRRGGLVTLNPVVAGVLYAEGQFGSTGNADYYGAILTGSGGIDPKGTPHVWYDQSLQDGTWLPEGMPRVLVSSIQMDQN